MAGVAAPDVSPSSPPRTHRKRLTFGEDFRRFFLSGMAALLPTLITLWLLVKIWEFLWESLGQHIIFAIRQVWMADEFLTQNTEATRARFAEGLAGLATSYEPHLQLKQRVPAAIGLVRTGDTLQYANMILESG